MAPTSVDHVETKEVLAAIEAMEYCHEQSWTDGLPVVPPVEELVQDFIAYVGRDPRDVIARAEHLDRECTVELAAVNAVMAGCRREYFPVVIAAIEAFEASPGANWAWPQSTTGQTQLVIANGPMRDTLGFNSRGNLFGSGFRANGTIGRAVRLITLNAMGIRPHEFDQSTQASPSKYSFCIAENEEASPWEPLQVERGWPENASIVTALYARSTLHVSNRHSNKAEQILLTIAESMSYAGSNSTARGYVVVMGPEHARLVAGQGWSKAAVKQFLWENWGRTRGDLKRLGLEGRHAEGPDEEFIHFSDSPDSILLIVAGAYNAGISSVITASTASFASKTVRLR